MTDRAFFYDWLIVDVIFDEPRTFDPLNVQICDPARPTTCVSGGPGRRRWEFMALPANRSTSSTTRPPPGDCSNHGTPARTTPASSAMPSTASRPAGYRNGGEVEYCSPATPPTRHHRSPGKACAPACATPPTWHGSSTACSTAPRPTRSSTPMAPSERPTWKPSSSSPSRWAR